MGVVLGRFQLLRKFGFLLAEILFRCVTRTQIALKLGLRHFQFADVPGLPGKLPPKIRDHLVALSNFRTRDLAVVAGIAQLFFKRGLNRAGLVLDGLWSRGFDDFSRPTHADAVGEETDGHKKQNSGGIEHPDVPPCGVAREWEDAMWEIRRTVSAIGPISSVLFLTGQAVEECFLRLFLRPIASRRRYGFRRFAGGDRGNHVTDYRFVLPKRFAAGRTNGKVLL